MRRIVILGYRDAELLDIACPASVFDTATRCGADPGYQVEVVSLAGAPIRTSCGITLAAAPVEQVSGHLDAVVVSGGLGHQVAAEDGRLLRHLIRLAAASRRIVSVCTGATLLAAAGLLDDRRATTHWMWAPELARDYPSVAVDPDPLFVSDGNVHTSAGVTSALDLALDLVAQDHGFELARTVARLLVTYLQRPGSQAQVSLHMAAPASQPEVVRLVCTHVLAHLDGDLRTDQLARVAQVSPRHLARLFTAHLGTSPARYVRRARTEAAAHLLTKTRLPVAAIARRCGFGSSESLRQAFSDLYYMSPSAHRRAARKLDAGSLTH